MKKDFRSQNLLSELFLWPAFVEHDDCVFLADSFSEEKYQRWLEYFQKLSRGKAAVEIMLNCVRICELFILPPAKATPRLAKEAAETIRTAWQTKLKSDFPKRIFDVTVVLDDPPEASEVSFFQPKHISIPPE
jgi:hypothetical protein